MGAGILIGPTAIKKQTREWVLFGSLPAVNVQRGEFWNIFWAVGALIGHALVRKSITSEVGMSREFRLKETNSINSRIFRWRFSKLPLDPIL